MAENSKIEWCHHTMNFWLGCTALSPACDNCYAEAWSKRAGKPELWQGLRQRTTAASWKGPAKWNARCAAAGIRERVFTNSLADFFDNQAEAAWRNDAWEVIAGTPHLDWMLLTKRPQNIAKMLPAAWGDGWRNVWLGTTVEDRKRLINIGHLRAAPAAVRFLSIEPLLESLGELDLRGIHLVIIGGESGPKARPMRVSWVRSIIQQCRMAGVACFVKQMGRTILMDRSDAVQPVALGGGWQAVGPGASEGVVSFVDRKGGDPLHWPADLRVREMPEARHVAG